MLILASMAVCIGVLIGWSIRNVIVDNRYRTSDEVQAMFDGKEKTAAERIGFHTSKIS